MPALSTANLGEEALIVAAAFANGDQHYTGPTIPSRVVDAKLVFTCAGREYAVEERAGYYAFILEFLRTSVGKSWLRERSSTKAGRKQPLVQLFSLANEYARGAVVQPEFGRSTHSMFCGAQRELATLADDMVTLAEIRALPTEMIRRLKRAEQYQGARYELAVAAGLARNGFRIEWLPSEVSGPEFKAFHPITGDTIVIEAKSRHRATSQFVHRADPNDISSIEADVARLYHEAARKPTSGHPFAIFIDANIPYRSHDQRPFLGLEGLKSAMERIRVSTSEHPSPEFLLFVTTCGWYYALSTPAFPVRHTMSFPQWTTATPRNFNTYVALLQTCSSMYTVPQSGDIMMKADPKALKNIAFPSRADPDGVV